MVIGACCLKNTNPLKNALVIGVVLTLLILTSSGFLVPIYETPIIFQTLSHVNFFKVQFESVILILYRGRCESTPILYNSYGINDSQLNSNLYHLIIEGIILRLFGFVIVMLQTNPSFIYSFLKKIRKCK